MSGEPVRLYRFQDATWQDPWGQLVPVEQVAEIIDVEVTGTRTDNNGYADYTARTGVARDGSGRTFWEPHTIDGPHSWLEPDAAHDRRWWTPARRLRASGRYIDFDGQPTTTAGLAELDVNRSFT